MSHPHPILVNMETQEESIELDAPLYGTVFVYCGHCATEGPNEPLRRIGKAGGQCLVQKGVDFIRELMDASYSIGTSDSERYPVKQSGDWVKRAKFNKIRTGVLYEIQKDAGRINREEFAADLESRRYQVRPANLDAIVNKELGFRRSTASPHHLGLVRLFDYDVSNILTCWKCGTKARVGRERLAMAVEHVGAYGGSIVLFPDELEVRGSSKLFKWHRHSRSKRRRPRSDAGGSTS
jgi:hypothetical protein